VSGAIPRIWYTGFSHKSPECVQNGRTKAHSKVTSHNTIFGRRDNALLRLLYNTGARAQEVVEINVLDIRLSRPYLVRLHGKGYKERTCP
jgi:integrase/recombinase XerD